MNGPNIIPGRNIDWLDAKSAIDKSEDISIIDRGTVYIANKNGSPWAVVFWGSRDARVAQAWCKAQCARKK